MTLNELLSRCPHRPLVAVRDKRETRISPEWGQFRLATLKSDGHSDWAVLLAHCTNIVPELLHNMEALLHYAETPGDFSQAEALELMGDCGASIERAKKINIKKGN